MPPVLANYTGGFFVVNFSDIWFNSSMTELLHYDNNDQYRDAVDAEGDVVFIGDIGEDIDNLAAERANQMLEVYGHVGRVAANEVVGSPRAKSNKRPERSKWPKRGWSTRGGRSFHEHRIDPWWDVDKPELSKEQREVNRAGAQAARAELRRLQGEAPE